MKHSSPKKSALLQNQRYQSPMEKENKPHYTVCNRRSSSSKKRMLVQRQAQEACEVEEKQTVMYTLEESSEVFGKRKRKTEKQLSILQNELRGSNLLWSRQKIIEIAERTGMTETQIYKWWWDQTRKRVKRLKINNQIS